MKTNAGHKYRLCLQKFSLILLAEFLVRIVFIFNFASSAVSSGNFFYCAILCSTVSLRLLSSKFSDFLFQKDTRYFNTYITRGVFSSLHLKSIGVYFQTKIEREEVTTKRSTTPTLWRNVQ